MVRIVTDSASDIPPEVARELNICIAPMYVRFGAEVFLDGVELDTEQFYRKLISSRGVPTTSAPRSEDFRHIYGRLAEETGQIVSIHLSSRFSSAYQNAVRASAQVAGKCRVIVIDSGTAAMGLGLLTIEAAKLARMGHSLERIIKTVKRTIRSARVYACFENLEYLRMGGRIGRAEMLLGSAIKAHPIIGLEIGEVQPLGRERSRNRAMDRLCELAGRCGEVSSLAVEQSAADSEAGWLQSRLATRFPGRNIYCSAVSSAIAVHTGPRVVAVSVLGVKD